MKRIEDMGFYKFNFKEQINKKSFFEPLDIFKFCIIIIKEKIKKGG